MEGLFLERLMKSSKKNTSMVCCGLDIDVNKLPLEYKTATPREATLEFLREVIAITGPHVCAYKIQKAFLERYSKSLYGEIMHMIRANAPDTQVILDGKFGDIDNTMTAYFNTYLGHYGFDALVLNPYMGKSVWTGLTNWPAKAGVVLVRTSGEDSGFIQDLTLENGKRLWVHVLDQLIDTWKRGLPLIPVLSSLDVAGLQKVADTLPLEIPVFVAGVGAQGGAGKSLRAILGEQRLLMVNSSRGILFPFDRSDGNWRDAIATAVHSIKYEVGS